MDFKKGILIAVAVIAVGELSFFGYKTYSKFQEKREIENLEARLTTKTIEGIDVSKIIEYQPSEIAVNYPITKNESINESTKIMINSKINAFKAETSKDQNKNGKSELVIPFIATKLNDQIVSFKYDIYTYFEENQNKEQKILAETYDVKTGKKLNLQDILIQGDYLSVLNDYLKKERHSETIQDLSFSSFTFEEDSILLYINEIEVKIPLTVFSTLIKPEFLSDAIKEAAKNEKNKIALPIVNGMLVGNKEEVAKKKLVALTFDDGPSPVTTPGLLEYLKEQQVPVTFFTLGENDIVNKSIVKKEFDDGHQVASHTYHHLNLPTLSTSKAKSEIDNTSDVIESIIGVKPNAVRPPYGATTATLNKMYNASVILWDIDSLDWQSKNPDAIYREVMKNIHDGAIILMHDIYQTSVDGAKKVIPALKAKGYTFVTVNQLIQSRSKLENGKVYFGVTPSGNTNG